MDSEYYVMRLNQFEFGFCGFQYPWCFQSLRGTLQVCPLCATPGPCGSWAVVSPDLENLWQVG